MIYSTLIVRNCIYYCNIRLVIEKPAISDPHDTGQPSFSWVGRFWLLNEPVTDLNDCYMLNTVDLQHA